MNAEQMRAKLNRDLYLSARECLDPSYRNDGEAVRIKRDYTVNELFHKEYGDLTIDELLAAIGKLKSQGPKAEIKQFAGRGLLSALAFYGLAVALVYCDFDDFCMIETAINSDGSPRRMEYSGEAARFYANDIFGTEKMLPGAVTNHLYSKWLNPSINKYLNEGKFRAPARKPERVYYEQLTKDEAQYLINRLKIIYENTAMRRQKPTTDFNHN